MRKLLSQSAGSEHRWVLHALLIGALGALLYFPYLGSIPFFDKGEPREALAVQDIVQRGEWLVPLKRATDIPSKPPLFHWSAALVTKITGTMTEATIRLPSALYALAGLLLVYWLGRKIYDAGTGLLGASILGTMMIYQDQAISARVDMTLCFIVTLSLTLFFSLYRGYLSQAVWMYVFYAVVGIGTLAKGPLSVLVTALVAGSLVVIERRWDQFRRFVLHPGVGLMIVLASGWYVIAVTRGGEGFFDRQILEENLERFAGGSGHSGPVYYYITYLLTQTMPWGLFLPILLWDVFRNGLRAADTGPLFLRLWFLVMFALFSISAGKRPVYLLPLYPAVALMLAAWFYGPAASGSIRTPVYRCVAAFAAITGLVLSVIIVGTLWSREPGWFFAPIEGLLKPKDRANVMAVKSQLDDFGWRFTLLASAAAALWLSAARFLWRGRMRAVAHCLVAVAFVHGTLGWSLFMPVIAQGKSYKDFILEVNRLVEPEARLYRHGRFNGDSLIFYSGRVIERLEGPLETLVPKLGSGDAYVILPEGRRRNAPVLPPPLFKSSGKGPEGDATLILMRASLP
jgi:4-amino-4-deoxy-L-arabinose transferase-like glycosyltransferase